MGLTSPAPSPAASAGRFQDTCGREGPRRPKGRILLPQAWRCLAVILFGPCPQARRPSSPTTFRHQRWVGWSTSRLQGAESSWGQTHTGRGGRGWRQPGGPGWLRILSWDPGGGLGGLQREQWGGQCPELGMVGSGHGQQGQPLKLGTPPLRMGSREVAWARWGLRTLVLLGRGEAPRWSLRLGVQSPTRRPLGLNPGLRRARADTGNSLIAFAEEHQIPCSCTRAEPGATGGAAIAGVLTAPWSLPRGLGCWPGKGGAFPRPEAPTPPQESRPLSVPRTEPSCGTVRGEVTGGARGAALLTSWGWWEGGRRGGGPLVLGAAGAPGPGLWRDSRRPLPRSPCLPRRLLRMRMAGRKRGPSEGPAHKKPASGSLQGHCRGDGKNSRKQGARGAGPAIWAPALSPLVSRRGPMNIHACARARAVGVWNRGWRVGVELL